MRGNFIRYVGEKLVYFQGERYQDEQLGVLLRTLEDMRNLSGQLHWQKIFGLLSYQASLVQTPAIPTQALSGI
jgi:hypothetical protein